MYLAIKVGLYVESAQYVIKRLLKFDIEKETQNFKSQCQTINVSTSKIDFMKYLAEYNRNALESEI